ncbi:hypothetical protein [Croceicoccus sp. Ery5]|uniref:hypothetical protein n=1 Tax=Croceicoccus sp. Ery5 TaxID=1703340 RepID=UPI001E3DAE51|nr:hypothetical protein [Croceicoccus sp. Ery5]
MLLKRLTAAIIAINVVIAPIHAHAAPLGTVGAANARIAGPAGETSELTADGNGTLLILLGLLLIAGGVYVATKKDDDDTEPPPVSF